MGWFQRMKRAGIRKKKRKLQGKIMKYCNDPGKVAKYQRQLDELNAKYPSPYSKAPVTMPQQSVSHSDRAMASKTQQAPQIAPSKISYNTTSAPSKPATPTVEPIVSKPAYTPKTTKSQAPGPHVPAGNYFVQHEQLVSKIARTAAQRCAKWIHSRDKEWKPINNGYSSEYYLDITVRENGVDFNKLAYEGINTIWFKGLGMDDLPKEKTEVFLHALKPFLDVYFPQEIEKAFADVSPLIKRSTTVTFGEHHEGWDFDGRSYSMKCIHVSMKYTYPPAPKLKSW